jgi:fermentation-respiration switch protein FrsA (DUF1100 family)
MNKRRRIVIFAISVIFMLALIAAVSICVWFGLSLAEPAQREIGEPPDDISAENVSFESESGNTLHGWFIAGEDSQGVIILMHAIRGNRRQMIERARFLSQMGYAILLFDFQAHGESKGVRITFGYLESNDARAAVEFVRTRLRNENIGIIGVSLGGAACLLGAEPLEIDALVLESVYPDIAKAVSNRLQIRFGSLGKFLTPLLTWQLKPGLGVGASDFRPIDGIALLECPVFVIGGTHDLRTTIQDTRNLFNAAPEPKELWRVDGATHQDLYRYAGAEYERRIDEFFSAHLRKEKSSEKDLHN